MASLDYKSCLADPDLWYRAQVDGRGREYYSYILCYVDDILVIHHDAMPVLSMIDKFMKLKPDSVGDPSVYLGAKLKRVQLDNDVWCWTLSPSKYVHEAVNNCENYGTERFDGKFSLRKNAPSPFPCNYEAEMDALS